MLEEFDAVGGEVLKQKPQMGANEGYVFQGQQQQNDHGPRCPEERAKWQAMIMAQQQAQC